jgi:hypothetical protein
MSDKTLATRLQLKPGHRLRLVTAPEGYPDRFGPLPTGARLVEADEQADVILAFFATQNQLTADLPATLAGAEDAVLWICYPKTDSKVSDLSRQAVHNAIRLNGWKPVAQVNVDDTWSAIRARPAS